MSEEGGQAKSVLMRAWGTDGVLDLLEEGVLLRRTGIDSRAAQWRKKDKEIPFSEIHSVLFKRAKRGDEGFIQFVTVEVREADDWLSDLRSDRDWLSNIERDDNVVIFDSQQEAAFLEIKERLKQKLPTGHHPPRLRSERDDGATLTPPPAEEVPRVVKNKSVTNILTQIILRWWNLLPLRVREYLRDFGKPESPRG